MTNADVIAKAQAKGDYSKDAGGFFMLPILGIYGQRNFLLPHPLDLPPFWSPLLDNVYLLTLTAEKLWAQAVGIAVSKVASMDWTIDGPVTTASRETQFLQAFGTRGIARLVTDYLLSCNGAWMEIVHETRSSGSRVLGCVPLDSRRIMRTGDPERPALYNLLDGRQVEYRAHQIAEITDMPDPSGGWLGVGHCAADRAYTAIRRMHLIDLIVDDKLSDRRPNKLVPIKGVSAKELKAAFETGEKDAQGRGLIIYQGTVFLVDPGDDKLDFKEIDLKNLPENFDEEKARNEARLEYANAIGLDPLDMQEPRGGLGTGQQADILHEKSKGRGLGLFTRQLKETINTRIVSRRSTFTHAERDLRDELKKEQVNKAVSDRIKQDVEATVLQPGQGLQVMVDAGIYPEEFLTQDVTDDAKISGEENAAAVEAEQEEMDQAEQANVSAEAPDPLPDEITLKEAYAQPDGVSMDEPQPLSVMIAFRPDESVRRMLAVEGGEPVEDIHLTLALFDVQPGYEYEAMMHALTGFVSGRPTMTAHISGDARFPMGEDGIPVVALVDCPELPDFRQALVEAMRSLGMVERRTHGYIPHITRAYDKGGQLVVPPIGDTPFQCNLEELIVVVDYGSPMPMLLKDQRLVVKEDERDPRWGTLERALEAIAAHG